MGQMADVIVIGGGVIGLSIAYELAGRGVSVVLLEQGEIGKEASWAGAGMLPPGDVSGAKTPEARLRSASHLFWPEWSARLREETGVDNGYIRCGGLTVAVDEPDLTFSATLSSYVEESVITESIPSVDVRERWPFLSSDVTRAFFLPEMGQVRNPRHLKALAAGCVRRSVKLLPGHPVIGVERSGETIRSVRTPLADFRAGEFIFAGGAWSTQLLKYAAVEFSVEPIRGQMVLLEKCPLPFRVVIEQAKRYLVPRADGKILIGSTEERVGFHKANTADALAELLRFGTNLVPALKLATFVKAWSGLRPYRAGELPYLGRIDGLKNACVAAGHFRSGLQMSPITAVLIRQIVLGEAVQLPDECRL